HAHRRGAPACAGRRRAAAGGAAPDGRARLPGRHGCVVLRRAAARRPREARRTGSTSLGFEAMCRNIHTLYNFEPEATDDEIRGAALQYVRKISGFTKPSPANEAAFERAVDEVAAASKRLLDSLVTTAAPKDRAVEAERARARAAKRS